MVADLVNLIDGTRADQPLASQANADRSRGPDRVAGTSRLAALRSRTVSVEPERDAADGIRILGHHGVNKTFVRLDQLPRRRRSLGLEGVRVTRTSHVR